MTGTALLVLVSFEIAFPQAAALQPGVTVRQPLLPSQLSSQPIRLEAGNFVRLQVTVTGPELTLAWRDPQGAAIDIPDSPFGDHARFEFAAIATISGEHSLELKIVDPKKGASAYELQLLDLRPSATAADQDYLIAQRAYFESEPLRAKHTPAARAAALEKHEQAIRYYKASGGHPQPTALNLFLAGAVLAESANFRKALPTLQEALSFFQSTGDRYAQAATLNFIGGMQDVLGDPQQSLASFTQALDLFRQFSDTRQQGRVLNNMAKLEAVLANWQTALDRYKQALAMVQQSAGGGGAPDPRIQSAILHNMAVIYDTLGDFPQAIALFEQALPLRRSGNAPDKRAEADTLSSLGFTHAHAGRHAEALRYYELALQLRLAIGDRRGESVTRSYMGAAYAATAQFSKAHESHAKAVEYARAAQDSRFEAQAWLRAGRAFLLDGNPMKAVEATTTALAKFRAVHDQQGEGATLYLLARAESDRGNLTAAKTHIEQAVRVVESNRAGAASQHLRASYFATNQDLYSLYIDLEMRLGNKAAAFEASERSRSRSLLEMLAESVANIREGVDPRLLARERSLAGLLNAKSLRMPTPALQEEIRTLERELQDVEAQIRASSPKYAALTKPSPLTATQIQGLLDDDSLLLEYALGESRSYLWVVGKASIDSYELSARHAIDEQASRLYTLAVNRNEAEIPAATEELRRLILPKGANLANKRLVIVADGNLQRLPFSMLLLDTNETVMLPSASTLGVLRTEMSLRHPAPKLLAVFADPIFEPAPAPATKSNNTRILEHAAGESLSALPSSDRTRLRIPQLPFTRLEAEEILKAARGSENLRALGLQATRTAATSPQLMQYRYLHFATHGYLDSERPGFSALVLSLFDERGQPQDGFLRANDIYNLKLPHADLVVLSACQTGLGKDVRGEGLIGLTRAFMYAGAPRVIVSLWNVNDRATASLMADLYRRILKAGKRPSTALREAQLQMRRNRRWQSPYYWAAFVQHGEWQ